MMDRKYRKRDTEWHWYYSGLTESQAAVSTLSGDLPVGRGVLWGKDNWFLSWSAQLGMRAPCPGEHRQRASTAQRGRERRLISHPFHWALFVLIMLIIFPTLLLLIDLIASDADRGLCQFWAKFKQGKGLQTGRAVTQAERASLTLPPVANSDASPAWSVCANSRTQTQAAQPSVSAISVRFRECEINRWYYASSVLKLIDLSLFGGAYFQVNVATWNIKKIIIITP